MMPRRTTAGPFNGIRISPKLTTIWATCSVSETDWTKPRCRIRRAVERKPDYAPTHYNLGNRACQFKTKLDEAEASYRRAIEIAPDYGDWRTAISAICFAGKNRLDEAAASFLNGPSASIQIMRSPTTILVSCAS